MEETKKEVVETTEVKTEVEVETKSLGEIAEINSSLANLIVVHKGLSDTATDKLIDAKLLAGRFTSELIKVREKLVEAVKAETPEEAEKVFTKKWAEELNKKVEFEIKTLTKEEWKALIQANKETGLSGNHIELLYNTFKVK